MINQNCMIDLHLHLDGSLSIKSARELARLEGVAIPDGDEELKKLLMVSEDCKDLNEYLEKFDLPISVLQSEKSVELATYNLCSELKDDGYIYAEIRFAPQFHTQKGMTQREVIEAAIRGIEKSGFDAALILCAMRSGEDNSKENIETVNLTKEYLGRGVCACDLAGAEALFPNENYMYVFDTACKLGIPYTIHSGEAAGSSSVKSAIEMGAYRIGHGVRSIEDKSVVHSLVEKKIPIEVCPSSNIDTCMYEDIGHMPIKELLESGVIVTINSDNMSVSNIDARKDLQNVQDAFGYTDSEMMQFLINSAKAAFADEDKKKALIEKIKKEFETSNE